MSDVFDQQMLEAVVDEAFCNKLIAKDPRYTHYGYVLAKVAARFNVEQDSVRHHAYGIVLDILWELAEEDGLSDGALDTFIPEA